MPSPELAIGHDFYLEQKNHIDAQEILDINHEK